MKDIENYIDIAIEKVRRERFGKALCAIDKQCAACVPLIIGGRFRNTLIITQGRFLICDDL